MEKFNFKMAVVLFMVCFSIGSMAADDAAKGVVIDGKNIAITEISSLIGFNDGKNISEKDLAKGVFVTLGFNVEKIQYPNAEAVVRERFANKGIKLVDKIEDAGISLVFLFSGSVDVKDADKKAAYSNLPSARVVAANGGALVAGYTTNGPGALLGFAIGSMFPVDSKSLVGVQVSIQPKISKGFFGTKIESSMDDGNFRDGMNIHYKLEKDKEATDDVVLKMMTDQWIQKYIAL